MKKIIFLLFFISSLASATKQTSSVEDFKSLMHGVWAEFYTKEGKVLSYMTYFPEGRFHGYGYLEDDVRSYWFADGLWYIKGNQSCIVFTFDSFGAMKNKEESCVSILSVTEEKLMYRDNTDNSIHTLKKVSSGYLR